MFTRGQIFELAFWLSFAAGAFALTFNFNQELEIYQFGAYGWPRVVVGVIVLSALGQLYHDVRFGKARAAPEIEPADEGRDAAYYGRMAAVLVLPLVYAILLPYLGFYTLTPFFAAAFLYAAGERRWRWILGVTVLLYLFMVVAFARLFYVGLPVGTVRPFYDFSNWLLVLVR